MITLRFSTIVNDPVCFLIRQATWSEYSHVDVVMPDGRLLGAHTDGVKLLLPTYQPVAKVCYLGFDYLTEQQEADCLKFYRDQVGKPYDYGAVLGVLAHHDWRNMSSWFCSELAFAGPAFAGRPLLNEAHVNRITPGKLLLSPYLKPVSATIPEERLANQARRHILLAH